MRNFSDNPNIDNSNLADYPDGRIKDRQGTSPGTSVNERVYGDTHQWYLKLLRRFGIVANNLPDNETNGYQIIEALKGLPSKNDYVSPIGGSTVALTINTKINLFEVNEQIIGKMGVSFPAGSFPINTNLTGSNGSTVIASIKSRIRSGDYVNIIRTGSGVDVVALVDGNNVAVIGNDAGLLTAANNTEEAAAISTKATTPATNLAIWVRRVNTDLSNSYLATIGRNGLMSQADKIKLDAIAIINKGHFSGLDPGYAPQQGDILAVSGNIISAVVGLVDNANGTSRVDVTFANAMSGLNYYLRMHVQTQGSNSIADASIGCPVFKPQSSTTAQIFLREFVGVTQNLRIIVEAVNL